MSNTISSKGQVTVPKSIRDALGLKPGDAVVFVAADGKAEIRPVKRWDLDDLSGCLSSYAAEGEDIRRGYGKVLGKTLLARDKRKRGKA